MINSDCHNKDYLDYGFQDAVKLAKEVGFTKRVIFTDKGFESIDF